MTIAEYNQSVDDFSDALFHFVYKHLRDYEKSRDVVQDTYEKLWLKAGEVSATKVRAYLFTAAYHTMIDQLRKDKRTALFGGDLHEPMEQARPYSGLKEILEEAVSRLPDDQRAVIMLRDYEGYSYEEIAAITGLTVTQVKVYIFRGRQFLKKYIGSIETVV